MNLSLLINSTATKVAIWTAKNPFASRLIMLALPVTFAVAAVIMRNPPCGGGGGGSC